MIPLDTGRRYTLVVRALEGRILGRYNLSETRWPWPGWRRLMWISLKPLALNGAKWYVSLSVIVIDTDLNDHE